jgi:hypothetical protein
MIIWDLICLPILLAFGAMFSRDCVFKEYFPNLWINKQMQIGNNFKDDLKSTERENDKRDQPNIE